VLNTFLIPQRNKKEEINYARMITKEDYELKLNESALSINRKVRALYPRAFINHKNKNLKILKIRLLKQVEIKELKNCSNIENINEVNKVLKILKNEGIVISTKTIPVVILEIKLEGKNVVSQNQLIQQLNLKVGDSL